VCDVCSAIPVSVLLTEMGADEATEVGADEATEVGEDGATDAGSAIEMSSSL
jgi:hypothetical protein